MGCGKDRESLQIPRCQRVLDAAVQLLEAPSRESVDSTEDPYEERRVSCLRRLSGETRQMDKEWRGQAVKRENPEVQEQERAGP